MALTEELHTMSPGKGDAQMKEATLIALATMDTSLWDHPISPGN